MSKILPILFQPQQTSLIKITPFFLQNCIFKNYFLSCFICCDIFLSLARNMIKMKMKTNPNYKNYLLCRLICCDIFPSLIRIMITKQIVNFSSIRCSQNAICLNFPKLFPFCFQPFIVKIYSRTNDELYLSCPYILILFTWMEEYWII